jgi:hypothetical protein
MPLIVESVSARANAGPIASPERAAVPNLAGDALGTTIGPVHADRKRPCATVETLINIGYTVARSYRLRSLRNAQDFSQTTENRSVGGSIPPLGTILLQNINGLVRMST